MRSREEILLKAEEAGIDLEYVQDCLAVGDLDSAFEEFGDLDPADFL